jgi:hypothetical protein
MQFISILRGKAPFLFFRDDFLPIKGIFLQSIHHQIFFKASIIDSNCAHTLPTTKLSTFIATVVLKIKILQATVSESHQPTPISLSDT